MLIEHYDMGRKRRTSYRILTALTVCMITGCHEDTEGCMKMQRVEVIGKCIGPYTRSAGTEAERMIHDINILAFHEGELECSTWAVVEEGTDAVKTDIGLICGREYILFAVANAGYRLPAMSMDEIRDYRLYTVKDHFMGNRIPMSAYAECRISDEGQSIHLDFRRMMSKITLKMDRSRLSEDIEIKVMKASIGNCPASVLAFRESSLDIHDGQGKAYPSWDEEECRPLNNGKSISIYMPENMQGSFPDVIHDDSERVFAGNDPKAGTCSYIEIEMSYLSPVKCSSGGYLKYRFYLGEGLQGLDVERNCRYDFVISPEGDGLSENGWRIDKECIIVYTPSIDLYPGTYLEGRVGEDIHIRCILVPESTPLDIGMEELEYEKERGIFDYTVDSDGKGVVLHLKKPGTGIIYMTAGPPVNRSRMGVITVLPPYKNL